MKRIFLLIALVYFINFAKAQTADEIIAKHIEAMGGKEAWNKVNSMVTYGTLKVQGAEITIVETVLNGKGSRQDITAMGMNGYSIVTPTEGWNFMPFQGQKAPEPITADDLKEAQEGLDAQGTLLDYKAKGHTVELLGKDDVDGVDAYKLKETLKSGKIITFLIDPSTYFIIRQISKQKANGQEADVTTNLSNYQKMPEGIMVPMSIGVSFGELVITKVEVNKPVDEAIFKPSK